jgi:hypothetical protein
MEDAGVLPANGRRWQRGSGMDLAKTSERSPGVFRESETSAGPEVGNLTLDW